MSYPEDNFLPHWITPEESLRVDEIGKRYVYTLLPEGWVETPGEFESLHGVLIAWESGWIDNIFCEIVREVVDVSSAYIIVQDSLEQAIVISYLCNQGVQLDSIHFMICSYNSIWIRDYGPWFMRQEDNSEGIVDFVYNRPRPDDDTIPWRIGDEWAIPVFGSPLVHTGGNFMVDGLGTGFASRLIYEENPSYSPKEIDSLMFGYCGLEQFIVLQRINIEYTGHIDIWTKILNDTLVLVGEYAVGHPNANLLDQNADSISRCKNLEGFHYRVARMPMPWSIEIAPPTYLNSIVVNNKVLVPLWGLAEDDTALFIYEQLLPEHEIVGIDCSQMTESGGAIHCITMQVPVKEYIHIKHYPLPDSTNDTINPYRVRTQIITSSDLLAESTLVFYSVNDTSIVNVSPLSAVGDTPGVYEGFIPSQSAGDTVYYYILAKNGEGLRRTSPVDVPSHIYSFLVSPDGFVAEKDLRRPRFTLTTYPNPVHRNLVFLLNLPNASDVEIEIYNVLGQRIKTLDLTTYKPGEYTLEYSLIDDKNRKLVTGVYFYSISVNREKERGKFLLFN